MARKAAPIIYFAPIKDEVKIPCKLAENAGYDVYAHFEADHILIQPHQTALIETGLKSAFDPGWGIFFKERGSTGFVGIGQRAGVIDSGFRGEWKILVTNHSKKPLIIAKPGTEIFEQAERNIEAGAELTLYSYEKALTQFIFVELPEPVIKVVTEEEIMAMTSGRMEGKLGSSGK